MANWNSATNDQIITNNTLQSGVNEGKFTLKEAIPANDLGLTKARADQYVNIAIFNPTYSAKSSNQLVAKQDLVGLVSLNLTLANLDGDGADNQSAALDQFGSNPINYFGNSTENYTVAAGSITAYSYTTNTSQYSWTVVPSNSLQRQLVVTDETTSTVLYDQYSAVGNSTQMNHVFNAVAGRTYAIWSSILWTNPVSCWFTNVSGVYLGSVPIINTSGLGVSTSIVDGGSFQAYALRGNYNDFCYTCQTVYTHTLSYSAVDCAAACSNYPAFTATYYSPDSTLTFNSLIYTNPGLCFYDLTPGYYSDGTNCYQIDNNDPEFQFDADYILLTYQWTNGTDLDTRTRIVVPDIGQDTQPEYVGWGVQGIWPLSGTPIIDWGGDNTGQGYEATLIDLVALKAAYPSTSTITIDLRAFWYSTVGTNDVVVEATLWKGGTPIQQGSGGSPAYSFTNPTATATQYVSSAGKQITLQTQANSTSGQRVATMSYNVFSGVGSFNTNDTTTPSV